MRSRRGENMSKEVRTARGVPTHRDGGADLIRTHQGQLDWDRKKHGIKPDSLNVADNEG